jgi:hypothetical protein
MTLPKFGLFCGAFAALLTPALAQAQSSGAAAAQPFALVQPAPTAHVDSDARCLAASMIMSGAANPQLKSIGPAASLYYYGRIEGHGGRASLESRLDAEFKAFKATPQIVGPTVQTCAQTFLTRVAALKPVSAHLAQRYGGAPPPAQAAPPAR